MHATSRMSHCEIGYFEAGFRTYKDRRLVRAEYCSGKEPVSKFPSRDLNGITVKVREPQRAWALDVLLLNSSEHGCQMILNVEQWDESFVQTVQDEKKNICNEDCCYTTEGLSTTRSYISPTETTAQAEWCCLWSSILTREDLCGSMLLHENTRKYINLVSYTDTLFFATKRLDQDRNRIWNFWMLAPFQASNCVSQSGKDD